MARPSKKEREQKIHTEALTRFTRIQKTQREERLQALQDRRFCTIAGAQWEGPLGEQFANKPKFEFNKVHLAVIRIINEYRNNRITVDFVPKDGSKSDRLADACDDLYRADEENSNAEEAYDNAFEEGTTGGMGAWRLCNEYVDEEDPDNDEQRILFEPIYDADTCVFFDPDSKRQDKADAKYCFVVTPMTHAAYLEEYDDDPATWPKEISQSEFDWCTPDYVYVAEYYVVELTKTRVLTFTALDGTEARYTEDELEEEDETGMTLRQFLEGTGGKQTNEKLIKRKKIRKYIMSGGGILEDCGHIAGRHIPIIAMYGKRWVVDGIERFMGHVRLAKDAQRLKNMQTSKLGEISATSSVKKPLLTPQQIAGHQGVWAADNVKNNPYLPINPIMDGNGNVVPMGPVGYLEPPDVPPALAALLQLTEQDMQDLLGNQQDAEEIVPNTSGVAIELVQNKLDMQTFIYVDNMKKAIRRCGVIWLDMAKDVYVEQGRKLKGVNAAGETRTIELQRPIVDEKGTQMMDNDISRATFDVSVQVGPSSASRRASTVRALTSMAAITDDPETKQVLTSMAMMNMEGEGIGEVRDYFRQKLIKMGVVKPTDEEAAELEQELANQPPDPNSVYLEAAAEQASAEATKARADTVLNVAKAEKTKAETAKIIAETDSTHQQQALEVIDRFTQQREPSTVQSGE